MFKMPVSEAQTKASRKWEAKNKAKVGYDRLRRSAFSFVQPKPGSKAEEYTAKIESYKQDLLELKAVLEAKLNEI